MQSHEAGPNESGLAGRDVLALAAHEMRQSLTVIGGLAGALRSRGAWVDTRDRVTVLRTIERHVDVLTSSVEDLLDVARAEAGRLDLDLRCIKASALLRSTVERARAEHPAHVVVLDSRADHAIVRVDGRRIAQVMSNLIRNAASSAPAGTEIRVEAELDGNGLVVGVADQGPGIPADVEHDLFERFPPTAAHRGSVGLGLYLCRRIVEAHGGRIWSEATTDGATFRMALPTDGGLPS